MGWTSLLLQGKAKEKQLILIIQENWLIPKDGNRFPEIREVRRISRDPPKWAGGCRKYLF